MISQLFADSTDVLRVDPSAAVKACKKTSRDVEIVMAQVVRRAIVILGSFRSGMSTLTSALVAFGFSDLQKARHGSTNVSAIGALNARMLAELGSGWDDPRLVLVKGYNLADGVLSAKAGILDKYIDQAQRALLESLDGRSSFVIADPRISLFPELWGRALRDLGYEPRYILLYRNPIEVAQSIRSLNNSGLPRAHQLWLRYNLAALAIVHDVQIDCVLGYHTLSQPPALILVKLGLALGLSPDVQFTTSAAATFAAHCFTEKKRHSANSETVRRSPMIARVTRMLFDLLENWEDIRLPERLNTIDEAENIFGEFSLLAGNYIGLSETLLSRPAEPPKPVLSAAPIRRIMIHYHLFKNAGTSVDTVLQKSFGANWVSREFETVSVVQQQRQLYEFIVANPDALAISSHTLLLPVPQIDWLEVLPVIFVRHPLDRLKSAYEFERSQGAETIGSRLARQTDFAGYLRARLAVTNDRSCRNFQAYRLAMTCGGRSESEADRAFAAVEELPFVGLVEAFSASIAKLEAAAFAFAGFRGFDVRKNATAAGGSRQQRASEIRFLLGPDLFEEVSEANAVDMALYERVRQKYLKED